MQKNQFIFAYTNQQLDKLVITLSTERLSPYFSEAAGDRWLAVKLYEWNTFLSESFYGVLQGLEIALRNAFHGVLTAEFQRDDWYDIPRILAHEQREALEKAKARIVRDGKPITPGKVVAEVMFGFWVSLTGPAYAQTLWDSMLYKAFIPKLSRKAVHKRLDAIRKLRNRIAHHESILGRNLKSDFSRIIEIVHWICPTTAQWIRANSSFHPIFKNKPQAPQQQILQLDPPVSP